jgi:hypothetical protein
MINGMPYALWKYDKLLEQNLFMLRASDGTISLNDIDKMSLKERNFYYERLLEIKQQEKKQIEEMKAKHKNKK